MAARSIQEVINRLGIRQLVVNAICVGPMNELLDRIKDSSESVERNIKNELRDFLAHEVYRFCVKNNAMKDCDILTQFIHEVVKDIPATGDDE
jgi:hypothetical protein